MKNQLFVSPWSLRTLALALCLFLTSCGDSNSIQISGQPVAPSSVVAPQRLNGVWGGYFPGSSREHPEQGIEIRFDAVRHQGLLHAAAFVHRDNWEAVRHNVDAAIDGDDVTLTFDPGTPEEGQFRGKFLDQSTMRGTFTHAGRGESFEMVLAHSESVPLQDINPISDLPPAVPAKALAQQTLAQSTSEALTLQLEFDAVSEAYSPPKPHRILFGYYGHWLDVLQDQPLGFGQDDSGQRTTEIQWMLFFPDWVYLELFTSNLQPVFSVELPWWALMTLDGSRMAGQNYAAQTYTNTAQETTYVYAEVRNLKLSYQSTPKFYDGFDFGVTTAEPDYQDVTYSDDQGPKVARNVPGNTRKVLEYLGYDL